MGHKQSRANTICASANTKFQAIHHDYQGKQ